MFTVKFPKRWLQQKDLENERSSKDCLYGQAGGRKRNWKFIWLQHPIVRAMISGSNLSARKKTSHALWREALFSSIQSWHATVTDWKNINCDQIFTLLRLLGFVRKIRRYEDGRFFYTLHQFTPFICCNIVLISLTYFIYNWELEEWEGLVEEKEVCSFTTKTGKKGQKGNV